MRQKPPIDARHAGYLAPRASLGVEEMRKATTHAINQMKTQKNTNEDQVPQGRLAQAVSRPGTRDPCPFVFECDTLVGNIHIIALYDTVRRQHNNNHLQNISVQHNVRLRRLSLSSLSFSFSCHNGVPIDNALTSSPCSFYKVLGMESTG